MMGETKTVRVLDLRPGDVVALGGRRACFISDKMHPLWPGLSLVIWRLDDGSVTLDALDPKQVVGEVEPHPPGRRADRLHEALTGNGLGWLAL